MQIIDGQPTGNDFTAAVTIQDVWQSNGGYFAVTTAQVFMQLQYGSLGQGQWTREVPVPVGNGIIYPGTSGMRFRSYTTGQPGTISAALSEQNEPSVTLGSPGVVSGVTTLNGITGQVDATGAVVLGTGYGSTRVSVGRYAITFTTAFVITPTINVTLLGGLGTGGFYNISGPTTTGFTVSIEDQAANLADKAFHFTAIATQ